jgi:hypothetical protein
MSEDYSAFCECDSYSEFLVTSRHVARKPHKCYECAGAIAAGETYEKARGRQEGEFWEAKVCARCTALVDWIKAHVPCFCRTYGVLLDSEYLEPMVEQARQTPGFAFGILRRVVAVKRATLAGRK